MITLRPFYTEDLLETEKMLAMEEYWDDLGSWWSNSRVEEKIIMLGRFVKHGGKIEDVLDRYRDGISENRASRIKPCIFRYLGILMAVGHINRHSPLYQELDSIPESDLIGKLSELLICYVKEVEARDSKGKICMNYEIVIK